MNHPPLKESERIRVMRPNSESANMRQAIYAYIKAQPERPYLLADIAKATHLAAKDVYAGAKILVKKNFATRHKIAVETKRKKTGEMMKQDRIGIQYVDPWSSKLSRKW